MPAAVTPPLLGLLLLAGAAGSPAAEQTVYRWLDDDGIVHYGQEPPAGRPAEAIEVPGGPSDEALEEAQERQQRIRQQANELADQRIRLEGERLEQSRRRQQEMELEEYERRLRELEERDDRVPWYGGRPWYPPPPGRPPGQRPPGHRPPGQKPPGRPGKGPGLKPAPK